MRPVLFLLAALMMFAPVPAFADMTGEKETYELLFRSGTLDELSDDATLTYSREVTNSLKPEAAERDTGKIELTLAPGEPPEARLRFVQGEQYRNLGTFPASVGNPIIMYFVETVVRDMAESAGGSPFYIRNRVKDALVQPAEIEQGELSVDGEVSEMRAVTLRPFADDPNADRMQGFDGLALTVTMSDAVPGWYHKLEAHVSGADGEPIYDSVMTLEHAGEAE